MSAAGLQVAQRGIVRLAMRRPWLFAIGGLAIVGGLVLASRRRSSASQSEDVPAADSEIGEGSYAGARDYHDRTTSFLKSEGPRVTARARQAKKALEGKEGPELEAAEAEGRGHARS